jgi:hypothetical protein
MVRRLGAVKDNAARIQGGKMIFIGLLAFVATAGVFVWAALKTSAIRERQEEERQRKAEQLVKGGSIFK